MKYLYLITFTLFTLISNGQTEIDNIFKNLKNGAILVRLESKQKTILALKEKNSPLSKKIETEQNKRNQRIIDAFQNDFNICSAFFFYDYHSIEVKNKNFKGVLLDTNLKELESIPSFDNNYLIAEFSYTKGDSIQTHAHVISTDKEGNTTTRDTEYVQYEGYNFDALVLLTPNLHFLQDPYPHFVRQNVIIKKRSEREMVQKMEKKILKYSSNKE